MVVSESIKLLIQITRVFREIFEFYCNQEGNNTVVKPTTRRHSVSKVKALHAWFAFDSFHSQKIICTVNILIITWSGS